MELQGTDNCLFLDNWTTELPIARMREASVQIKKKKKKKNRRPRRLPTIIPTKFHQGVLITFWPDENLTIVGRNLDGFQSVNSIVLDIDFDLSLGCTTHGLVFFFFNTFTLIKALKRTFKILLR